MKNVKVLGTGCRNCQVTYRLIEVKFGQYPADLVRGDLGTSYQKSRPVTDILFDKFPNTFRLAFAAILVEIVIGIGAGLFFDPVEMLNNLFLERRCDVHAFNTNLCHAFCYFLRIGCCKAGVNSIY